MSNEIQSWNYNQLPKGVYSAVVRPHNWPDYYVFQAFPNRGDWCWEYLSKDLADVLRRANEFAQGKIVEGIYTASF